jgi:hypothetical protein
MGLRLLVIVYDSLYPGEVREGQTDLQTIFIQREKIVISPESFKVLWQGFLYLLKGISIPKEGAGGMAQVVECLPSKHKVPL